MYEVDQVGVRGTFICMDGRTKRGQAQAARAAQGGCPPGLPNVVAQLARVLQAAAAQQPEQARHQPLVVLGITL